VLLAFGIYTLLGEEDEEAVSRLAHPDRLRPLSALALGVSISLDELAIGFTIGLARLPVAAVLVGIAVQAFVAVQLGLRLGARVPERWREYTQRAAGVVLIALGAFVALTHRG
jgi:manganese efflux pump family protein